MEISVFGKFWRFGCESHAFHSARKPHSPRTTSKNHCREPHAKCRQPAVRLGRQTGWRGDRLAISVDASRPICRPATITRGQTCQRRVRQQPRGGPAWRRTRIARQKLHERTAMNAVDVIRRLHQHRIWVNHHLRHRRGHAVAREAAAVVCHRPRIGSGNRCCISTPPNMSGSSAIGQRNAAPWPLAIWPDQTSEQSAEALTPFPTLRAARAARWSALDEPLAALSGRTCDEAASGSNRRQNGDGGQNDWTENADAP